MRMPYEISKLQRGGGEQGGVGGRGSGCGLAAGRRPLAARRQQQVTAPLGGGWEPRDFKRLFFFLHFSLPYYLFFSFFPIEKVFASLPQVERGVSKIIGGDPKGNNFLYTNGKCVVIRNIDVMYPDVFILSLCVPPREVTPLLPSPPSFPRLPVFPSRRGAALEVTAQRSARGTGRCVTQAEAAGSGCRNS